jgi:hypothetical protein
MKTTFSFEGGLDAAAALRRLADSKAAVRAGRAALREAAAPIVADAKVAVPVDKGDLRRSIKVATGRRERGSDGDVTSVVIGIDLNVQPPREVPRADGNGTYRDPGVAGVAVIQEFDPENGGNPFMRPAWDANSAATPGRVGKALGPAIEREAERLARRRSRG